MKPHFVPGESITWDVTWAGVRGGRARLAVGQVGGAGHRVVVLRAEAESSGIATLLSQTRDTIDSWVDVDSGLPERTESITTTSDRSLVVKSERVPGVALAKLDVYAPKYGPDGMHRSQRLPAVDTHDPLSVVLALRAWDAPRGARVLLYSLGGTRIWKNVFTAGERETIDSPLGRRAVVQIHGVSSRVTPALEDDLKAPPRTYTVWVTDDAQRIPLQIVAHTELGDVTATASSYQVASDVLGIR